MSKESKSRTPRNEYEAKAWQYLGDFWKRRKADFRPHILKGGLHPKELDPKFKLVLPHNLAAGVYAQLLTELFQESGNPDYQLSTDSADQIVSAANMHDWRKYHETQRFDDIISTTGTLTLADLESVKSDDEKILKELGVPDQVIALTGANVPENMNGPEALPEKIIWYVDAMLTGTNAVPIRQRFDNIIEGTYGADANPIRANRSKIFDRAYHPKYGQNLFQVQRNIGERLNIEFANAVGYEGDPNDFPLFLKAELDRRIMAFGK